MIPARRFQLQYKDTGAAIEVVDAADHDDMADILIDTGLQLLVSEGHVRAYQSAMRDMRSIEEELRRQLASTQRQLVEVTESRDQWRHSSNAAVDAHLAAAIKYETDIKDLHAKLAASPAATEKAPCKHEWVRPTGQDSIFDWEYCGKCLTPRPVICNYPGCTAKYDYHHVHASSS